MPLAWVPFAALLACNGVRLPCNACLEVGPCSQGVGQLYPIEEGAWWRHDMVVENMGVEEETCKLVSIAAEDEVTLKPGVRALPAHSIRVGADGLQQYLVRWQEISDCSIVRHVDEIFLDETLQERSKIKIYCPQSMRLPECPGACRDESWEVEDCEFSCEGATWTDESHVVAELTAETPEAWEACLAMQIDPQTCTADEIPAGCTLGEPEAGYTDWEIDEVGQTIEAMGEVFETIKVSRRGRAEDGSLEAWDSYWWARGVGKVHEFHAGAEEEWLMDRCLPADGCDRGPPTVQQLVAACQP